MILAHLLAGPPTVFDHLIAIILVAVFPIRAKLQGYQRLLDATPAALPTARRQLYGQAMRLQWGVSLLLVAEWAVLRPSRRLSELGLRLGSSWSLLAFLGAVLVASLFLVWQARRITRNEKTLDRLAPRLERMGRMLPHDLGERRLFLWLALTAGVCEELLYRGFLIRYFGYWLSPTSSWLLSSLFFGVAHFYQGWRGVAVTGLLGALLGLVYLLSGSLLPSMVVHSAIDAYSGWIGHAALSRQDARAAALTSLADPPPAP